MDTEGGQMRWVDQGHINFIQYLEKAYKVDIKRSSDYVAIRHMWVSEGKPMSEPKIVRYKRSQSLRKPIPQRVVGWDFKANPIHWEDTL